MGIPIFVKSHFYIEILLVKWCHYYWNGPKNSQRFSSFLCLGCGKFPWIILLWLASWPACGMITCDKGTQGATMAEWAVTSPTSTQLRKPDYEHTSVSFVYINHVMWFLMLLCRFSIWIQANGVELNWFGHSIISMVIIAAWNEILVLNCSDNGWICLMQVITWTNWIIAKQMHQEHFLTHEHMEIHGCILPCSRQTTKCAL